MGVGYLSKDIKDNKKKIIIRAIILLLIIGIVLVVFFANKDISGYFNDSSQIEGTIGDNGIWGMLIYIGLQAIQVIIAVIPGEPIQLAGGYIFGVWGGFILSAIGIMLGSSIGFFIAKRFGYPVVCLLMMRRNLSHIRGLLKVERVVPLFLHLLLFQGYQRIF